MLLDLADDVLDPVLEHAAQHRARNHAVHLEVDDLAVAQAHRDRLGLELDPPGEALDDGGLADAGLADEHHGVRALAVAENLHHLLQLLRRARRAAASCPAARSWFRLVAKCFRKGGSSNFFRSRSSRCSRSRIRVAIAGHEQLRLDAVPPDDRDRDALALLEDGGEEVHRLDRPGGRARLAWWNASLKSSFVAGATRMSRSDEGRHHPQVLLQRLEDLVRVEVEVPHHLREHVPFDLRERQEDVLVGQQRVLAAPRFFDRAVDDALG